MNRFDLLYLLAAPVGAPYLLYKRIRHGKYRESIPAMFGRHLHREEDAAWVEGCVWVHAVSVGEVMAAKAMLPMIRQRFSDLPVLVTTVTETGQAQARSLIPDLADAVRYYPADFSWVVRRFASFYKPRVLFLMETELWPNALHILAESGTKLFVLNGKISENSFRNYSRMKRLLVPAISRVTAFCMQTEQDARRAGGLIGDRSRVFVTGNCKFDVPMATLSNLRSAQLKSTLAVPAGASVVVAGSTHAGEEELVLDAFNRILGRDPAAFLLLAPRHPERFEQVWKLIAERGLAARRLSDGAKTTEQPARILLVDKMGLLSELYGIASVAVVCGSFVPGIGGHNLLEAAVHGVPVIYGPHMQSQPDMVRIVNDENGGIQTDASGLRDAISNVLDDPGSAAEKGKLAREAVLANRGAARRNIEIVSEFL